jgi:release factor glutamine methyltransferase
MGGGCGGVAERVSERVSDGPVSGPVRSLKDAVREAVRTLADAGVESAEFDAIALAACAAKTTTGDVHKQMIMGSPVPEGFDDLVAERARRVPLQHLTGKAGFRRLELSVGPGVFVPRFETEFTAGLAIAFLHNQADHTDLDHTDLDQTDLDQIHDDKPRDGAEESGANLGSVRRSVPRFEGESPTPSLGLRDLTGPSGIPVVVDLCTGSGAIALAVKDEVPSAAVHGVELSGLAHAWATRNRDDLGLDVDFRLGDATLAFPELEAAADVVVSNPPYIPVGSIPNDPEVRDHDPEVALYGGSSDGLRIPLEVAARAAFLLRPGGFFVMEHADVQGESLTSALRMTGLWQDVQDHTDLNGRPRAATAVRAR